MAATQGPLALPMKTAKHKPFALFMMFLLTTGGHLFALDPSQELTQYAIQNWQREQGLPNNSVRAVAEAGDGHLLIGTASGLVKFDGSQFTALPVGAADRNANYAVVSLLVARNGAVWVGTEYDGLVVQNGSQSRVYTIADGLASNSVQSLYQDASGAIWVGTAGGVCRITATKMQCLPVEVKPGPRMWKNIVADNSGGILIAAQSRLFCWRHGVVTVIHLSGAGAGEVRTLFRDRSGKIWAGTTIGLFRLRMHSNTAVLVRQAGVPGPVLSLAEDQRGNLWISSFSHGLYRRNQMGLQHSTEAGHYIRTLFVDHSGDLWIGSRAIGLTRWADGSFIEYGLSEGLANSFAISVREDSHGILWLGSDGGLQRFSNGRITNKGVPTSLIHTSIRAITTASNGDVWVGSAYDGLYRLDGRSLQHWGKQEGLPQTEIRSLLLDAHGNLWAGFSPGGLVRFPNASTKVKRAQIFLTHESIYALVEKTPGVILAGTSGGLYQIADDLVTRLKYSDPVLSLSKDSAGKIWIGFRSGGVGLFEDGTVFRFTAKEGIPTTTVSAVVDDRHGFLWMATDRGIIQMPRAQMLAIADRTQSFVESTSYGKLDGMHTAECRWAAQPAAWRASNGDLWFATPTGFVRHASQTASDESIPKPVIDDIEIDGEDLPATSQLKLLPGTRELVVHFGSVWLTNPQQLQFRYKLVGFDRNWRTETPEHAARYVALSPGRYQFLVQVRSGLGPWSRESADLALRQRPYFYQMLWFQILGIALAGAMLWLWARWYRGLVHGKLSAVIEERNRISREWHDSLMAGFAAIAWQLEATRDMLLEVPEEARSYLELARDMVRHTQAEARRIIWDLRLNLDERVRLSEALADLCRRLSDTTHVSVTTELQGLEAPLPSVLSHNLLRIAQESLHNAIRHAQPTLIVVRLCYEGEAVTLCVKDNGCGFQQRGFRQLDEGHLGLLGMAERAHRLGGHLDVRSSLGAGTEVIVTFAFRGQTV